MQMKIGELSIMEGQTDRGKVGAGNITEQSLTERLLISRKWTIKIVRLPVKTFIL